MRISFTNHSKETQSVYIVRRPNGSLTDVELFSKVKIAPEQTVTRAFYLEKDDLEIDYAAEMSRVQKEMREVLAQEMKSQKMLEDAFRGIGYGIE